MPIATRGVDHIDLSVGDLAMSVVFYDQVLTELGFRRLGRHGNTEIWRGGKMEVGLREARQPTSDGSYDRYRVGLHHLAFQAETRADVDSFHAFLVAKGLQVLDAPALYPQYGPDYYAVFFADPDGMKLELVYRTKD